MKTSILRYTALFTAASVLFVFSILAVSGQLDDLLPVILSKDLPSVKEQSKNYTLILDAGHGGEDGGAVSLDGTPEKDLNLEVALRAASLLRLCGVEVLLTRETDRMLGDGEKGQKKIADLRARLDFANAHDGALFCSIHMNKFPMEYCRGVQLYYSPNNEKSLTLAQCLHRLVKESFQPENDREIKNAGQAIYLLDRVTLPAILMECGFLSNPEEAALLKTKDYQQKLSVLILSALSEYDRAERASV